MKIHWADIFSLKPRRVRDYQGTFNLDPEGIEEFSSVLDELLQGMDVEKYNRIRIRLSFEESALRMRDHFGEGKQLQMQFHEKLGRTYIQIEVEGDIYNPLSKVETELEDWSGSLLTSVGLAPSYRYSRGRNILRLNMGSEDMSAAFKIIVSVGLGLLSGLLLMFLLPEGMKNYLVSEILSVVYTFWVRI
ncbi:MAG: hypothetical protein II627_09405, partial [Lachnospiraceae bacterium]|nr:hypothetical protein [Lachnospiraceae bacterium]